MANETVLIVEETLLSAEGCKGPLQRMGYRVAGVAWAGGKAIADGKARRQAPVLMQILLGGPLDDIPAAEAIRARWDLPVVSLIPHSDQETLDRVRITEPLGYLLKPFDLRKRQSPFTMALRKHRVDQKGKDREVHDRFGVERTLDVLLACDIEGLIPSFGSQARRDGFTPDAIVGHPILDFVYPEGTGASHRRPESFHEARRGIPMGLSLVREGRKPYRGIVPARRRERISRFHRETVLVYSNGSIRGNGIRVGGSALPQSERGSKATVGICRARRVGRKARPFTSSFENTRCHLRDVR